jgi:hypothetical protein
MRACPPDLNRVIPRLGKESLFPSSFETDASFNHHMNAGFDLLRQRVSCAQPSVLTHINKRGATLAPCKLTSSAVRCGMP